MDELLRFICMSDEGLILLSISLSFEQSDHDVYTTTKVNWFSFPQYGYYIQIVATH